MSYKDFYQKISDADFMIVDKKFVNLCVGLRYNSSMSSPEVCFMCIHHEMNLAKFYIFRLGKKLFYNDSYAFCLFRKYYCGQQLQEEELLEAAKMYSSFYKSKRL